MEHMLDGGEMAQIRATVQQRREEVYAFLQYAASCHCMVEKWHDCEELQPKPQNKWTCVKKVEAKKHRTGVVCDSKNGYRCMRCGRSSNNVNMPGKCEDPRWWGKDFNPKLEETEKRRFGRACHGWKSGPKWRGVGVVQEVFGLCAVPSGTKADAPLLTRKEARGPAAQYRRERNKKKKPRKSKDTAKVKDNVQEPEQEQAPMKGSQKRQGKKSKTKDSDKDKGKGKGTNQASKPPWKESHPGGKGKGKGGKGKGSRVQ